MSIYLRVTEESSTKMGILRFSILILFIYFFSNFLHINWCSNSGLLDFRCGGPKKRIAVSLLPGVSSPEGEGTLQPGENSLASLPTGPPCWLWHGSTCWKVTCSEDVSIVFFFGGCDRCFTVKYLKSIVDTQSDIRSTWRREHLPKDASRSDDWFNFCQMSDECEFCNNSEDVSSSSSEIKEIFLASIAMWWFFRRGQKWSNALSLGKQIIFFLIPHPKIPPKKSAHIRDSPSDAYMVSIFQILHAFAPFGEKNSEAFAGGNQNLSWKSHDW